MLRNVSSLKFTNFMSIRIKWRQFLRWFSGICVCINEWLVSISNKLDDLTVNCLLCILLDFTSKVGRSVEVGLVGMWMLQSPVCRSQFPPLGFCCVHNQGWHVSSMDWQKLFFSLQKCFLPFYFGKKWKKLICGTKSSSKFRFAIFKFDKY